MAEHSLIVAGIWHNDSTAGVGIYCNDCNEWVLDGDDSNDELTVEMVSAAAEMHRDSKGSGPLCGDLCGAQCPDCGGDAGSQSPSESGGRA